MGRAQQQQHMKGPSRRSSRQAALNEFNQAASQRAHIAQLIDALAKEETQEAISKGWSLIIQVAQELGLSAELLNHKKELTELATYNLHTELRVALDEGRRITENDVLALSESAVRQTVCGFLAPFMSEKEDLPLSEAYSWLRSYLSQGKTTSLERLKDKASLDELLAEIS